MSLADELSKKLEGGKFRLLNEKMYKNKDLTEEEFTKYHIYYSNQVKKWPVDPKTVIISKIESNMGKDCKIADLGCGDGLISKKFPNVKSFDKYPVSRKIIKSDLTSVEAEDKEFDVAVCCLSMMMTYITKVVKEANRILKKDGQFYIAEVTSRIRSIKKFIGDFEKFGFKLKEVDTKNTHFTMLVFTKIEDVSESSKLPTISLNPCLYKKR